MKWDSSSWAKVLCLLVAILITGYLYISNLPPFSLVGTQEEITTGIIPTSAESPIMGNEAVMVFVPASLDQTIAADNRGLRMQEGANTWTKTITLINPSAEPVGVYFFVQGVKSCSEMDPKDCVQFPSQVTVGAHESASIEVAFSEISPQDSVPVDGKLILAGAGSPRELPFSIRGAWQKEPIDYLDITSKSIAGGFTLLLVVMVISLLYGILLTRVSPFFLPEKHLPFQMDVRDDDKPLWTIFHSRLREFKEQGLVGNIVNPQPSFNPINNLPTNLGRDGDILKAIIELLNWLLPQRGKTIRLHVVESQTNGKGLSVSIASNSNGQLLAERVFWSRQYGLEATRNDVEDILMTPLILWLSDWKNQAEKGSFSLGQSDKRGRQDRKKKQTVSDKHWEIEADCILASSLWSTDRAVGKKLYLDVLRNDPANKQAQLGLGRILLEESNENLSPYEREKRLKLAIAYLDEVSSSDLNPQDPPWFAAKYSLAVARFSVNDLDGSKKDCDQLFAKLAGVRRRKGGDKSDNSEFWPDFTTMSLIFRHSVRLNHTPPRSQEDLDRMIDHTISEVAGTMTSRSEPHRLLLVNLHYRSQYNLACYFSRCYRLAKESKWQNSDRYADSALEYLRLALAHGGGILILAREDPALESIRADFTETFDNIVGRKAAEEGAQEVQNVTRLVVEGPIVLQSEPTPS